MTSGDQSALIGDLADHLRHRFYGKYRGSVTAVESATMRVKALVPAVLGDVATGWAAPCVPFAGAGFGHAFLPELDSGVWIEFEGGDVSYPIWSGCYWREGEQPGDATETVRLLSTPGGMALTVDDDAREIRLSDGHGNMIALSSAGITLERGGQSIKLETARIAVNDGALEVR